MIVLRLAWQSLANRRLTALLTILAIAVSVMLLLGVEKVRTGARQSFADTISGTDLIVGARSGALNLLLYSVFRIGNATNNVTWTTFQEIAKAPDIDWIVPISLGDSHHGFRVMGTTPDYFQRYRYRRTHELAFASGKPFGDLFDAVIGADVAAQLGYKVGDKIVVAHGLGSTGFLEHDDKPFQVSGILAKTGTPVDRTVHVSLEAIEAIHVDWQSGARIPGQSHFGGRGSPDARAAAGDHRRANRTEIQARGFPAPARHQRLSCRAAFGHPSWRDAAGTLGAGRHRRNGTRRGLCDGRGDGIARHGDDDPHHAERAAARDGDPALRRRAAGDHSGPADRRGGVVDRARRPAGE